MPPPFIPRDHAEKNYRRTTDRPPEEGPRALTLSDRILLLVSFVGSAVVVGLTIGCWLVGLL